MFNSVMFFSKGVIKFTLLCSETILGYARSCILQFVPMTSFRATPDEVAAYLRDHHVDKDIIDRFLVQQIDGYALCLLSEDDLREMGPWLVGQRKRLLVLAALWRRTVDNECFVTGNTLLSTSACDLGYMSLLTKVQSNGSSGLDEPRTPVCHNGLLRRQTPNGDCSSWFTNSEGPNTVEPSQRPWKVLVSAIFAFIVAGITSFVMVLAHERLPDISKYPPLPDLFLDNLPHISWAFEAAEWVGVLLMLMWLTVVLFHHYRWILLRRFFALMGTVFLLRSITMIITSLSVPGRHLTEHCVPQAFGNRTARFERALDIWFGFGMYTRGIRTCGDYMFSGHTTCLTLLNFFITEYGPRRFQLLHTASWVLNLFGVFFILASHEHYSIDVFVAVYVSSRLFLYYHCLANNRILHQEDKDRAMIWFPLFSFLEWDVNGIVPNMYEIPFSHCLSKWFRRDTYSQSTSYSELTKSNHAWHTDKQTGKSAVVSGHKKCS